MNMLQWFGSLLGRRKSRGKAHMAEIERLYANRLGAVRVEQAGGSARVSFGDGDAFDYEAYRTIQDIGNREKLDRQYVPEAQIRHLAALLKSRLGTVERGLCHGVRSGKEQAWFAAALGDAQVLGTDIADSAEQFPNTRQWDFHDRNPEWSGQMDFVYSNSWDHAYDFEKALAAWADSLRPGGLLLLDWTTSHTMRGVSALDPFGAELEALHKILAASGHFSGISKAQGAPGLQTEFVTLVCARANG